MTETASCRNCGARLNDPESTGTLCPACMMRGFLDADLMGREVEAGQELPRRFGDYDLLEEIGRGGMGMVYRARQLALDRIVAVKLLIGGRYSGEAELQRFRTEAAAAAGLHHPNIVAIHDYGEEDGQPFYVMDLIEGRNLAEICAGIPIAPARAARWLRRLADAIHYAHEQGVLHRDLKPSNVVVDSRDEPHITDFGLAKRLDAQAGMTLSGQILGSPGYMAPEQVQARGAAVGPTTDIYGLGALLYHLVTGRAPHSAATPVETLQQILDRDPPAPRVLNPEVPRDLETICLKCLERDPGRRYASARQVAEDADRFLTQRPVLARRPGSVYRAAKFARRHWMGVSAVAGIMFALAVGLAAALAGYRQAVAQQNITEAARVRSQEMVRYIMTELRSQLQALGRRETMVQSAEAAVRYFEGLPAELRDAATLRAHAVAEDLLAEAYGADTVRTVTQNLDACREACVRAGELWGQIVSNHPDDPAAAAALLMAQFRVAFWYTPDLSGPVRGWILRDFTEKFRGLARRFPDHPDVQIGLMTVLHRWLDTWSPVDPSMEERMGIAREALHGIERALAVNPDSAALRTSRIKALINVGAYRSFDDRAGAAGLPNDVMDIAARLLEQDPTNISYLELAALAAKFRVFHFAAHGDRPLERMQVALDYYGTLKMLDPHDPEWQLGYAQMLLQAAWSHFSEGRPTEGLRAAREANSIAETLRAQGYALEFCLQAACQAGKLAVKNGDLATAEVLLEELHEISTEWIQQPDADRDPLPLRRYHALFSQCDLAFFMDRPADMEHFASAMLIEAEERVPLAYETEETAAPFRAAAQAYLGHALYDQGRIDEAALALDRAVAFFQKEKPTSKLPGYSSWHKLACAKWLADCLCQQGETARSAEVLEWVLEKEMAQAESWRSRESCITAAWTAWGLAELLAGTDQQQAQKRRAVLIRTLALLQAPDMAPRLNDEERELRERIEKALLASSPEGDT